MISGMKDKINVIPFEVMDAQQIKEALTSAGLDHFIDPTFPPLEQSLFDYTNQPEYPFDEMVVWKRPREFMRGNPELFLNESGRAKKGKNQVPDVDPNDIRQGALGDCWFLASIASLAEAPATVKKLFITDSYNEYGIYQLRLCKNGEWVVVTIDDYIPCHMNGGPMFTSANGNELWCMLLEKAYAKLHGNYWQLRAGYVSHGMMDLSGCPTKHYQFPAERHNFDSIRGFADQLWSVLLKSDGYGHIMCGGTPGVDVWTEKGGPNQEHGIVPGIYLYI